MEASQASVMKPGLPVTITFRDLPGQRYQGRVSRVVTQSQPGGSAPQYLALVGFSNSNGAVKPDMAAEVSIELGRVENALTVPNSAVRTDADGRTYVEVQRGGNWQRQDVTTGLRGNEYTEITSGLQEGDTVRA